MSPGPGSRHWAGFIKRMAASFAELTSNEFDPLLCSNKDLSGKVLSGVSMQARGGTAVAGMCYCHALAAAAQLYTHHAVMLLCR